MRIVVKYVEGILCLHDTLIHFCVFVGFLTLFKSLFLTTQRKVGNTQSYVMTKEMVHAVTAVFSPLSPELNPICYLLALLGAHHFLHVSRIRVKLLTFRLLMAYIYGAPILDVSRSHTTTQHSR